MPDKPDKKVQVVIEMLVSGGGTIKTAVEKEAKEATKSIEQEAKRQQKITDDHLKYNIRAAKDATKAQIAEEQKAAAVVNKVNQDKYNRKIAADRKLEAELSRTLRQNAAAEARFAREQERLATQAANAKIKEARRAANEFIRSINQSNQATSKVSGSSAFAGGFMGGFVGTAAVAAVSKATSLAHEGASAWLDYASKLEQARIGMTTMTGSVTLANQHLAELQTFAAKTPFEFGDLVQASQKLQGVGFAAKDVIPALTDVGNALSAAGHIEDLNFAIKALGDIQSKGKLAGQEVIQLANAGIPVWKILSETLHKTVGEVQQLSEDGRISSELFLKALHEYSNQHFGDSMEQQSKTFAGAMSNIKDALFITAEQAFKPLYERISKLALRFSTDIQAQKGDLNKVGAVIGQYISEGIGQALGLFMSGLGTLIGARLREIFQGNVGDPFGIGQNIIKGISKGIFGDSYLTSVGGRIGWATPVPQKPADPYAGVSTFDYTSTAGPRGTRFANPGSYSPLRKREFDYGSLLAPGKEKKSGGRDVSGEKSMREFFAEELGFRVNRTFGRAINPGSMHPSGRAIDVDFHGLSNDALVQRIAAAIEKGYQFVDERVKRPGIKQTGPHLHFEKDPNDPSSFLGANMYGGQAALDYLKKIDLERRKRGTGLGSVAAGDELKRFEEMNRQMEQLKAVNEDILGLTNELGLSARSYYGITIEGAERNKEHLEAVKRLTGDYAKQIADASEDLYQFYHPEETAGGRLIRNFEEQAKAASLTRNEYLKLSYQVKGLASDLDELARNKKAADAFADVMKEHEDWWEKGLKGKQDAREDRAKKAFEAQEKAAEEYRDKMRDIHGNIQGFFENSFHSLREGGFKGLFKSWLHEAESFLFQLAAKFLASKVMKFLFPEMGGGAGQSLFGGSAGMLGGGKQGGGMLGQAFNSFTGGGSGGGKKSGGGNIISNAIKSFSGLLNFGGKGGAIGAPGGGFQLGRTPGLTDIPGLGGGAGGGFGKAPSGGIGALGSNPAGMFAQMYLALASSPQGRKYGFGPGGFGLTKLIKNDKREFLTFLFGGAGFLSSFLFSDPAIKKLKEAASSEFGLTVENKQTLRDIKRIGEVYFGLGGAAAQPKETVHLDESKNILREYAKATGQRSNLLDMDRLTDPDAEENQITSRFGGFRARGGPVYRSMDYIVGERGPEVFRPNVNGSIIPNGAGADNGMMRAVMETMAGVLEAVEQLTAKVNAISPGDFVGLGLKQNPGAAADAHLDQLENNHDYNRANAKQLLPAYR